MATLVKRCPVCGWLELGQYQCSNCGVDVSMEEQVDPDVLALAESKAKTEALNQLPVLILNFPWGTVFVDEQLTVGRDPDYSTIADDCEKYANVSLRHAEVRISTEGYLLTDIGSTNGTFVNGVRCTPKFPTLLENGMVLSFARDLRADVVLQICQ